MAKNVSRRPLPPDDEDSDPDLDRPARRRPAADDDEDEDADRPSRMRRSSGRGVGRSSRDEDDSDPGQERPRRGRGRPDDDEDDFEPERRQGRRPRDEDDDEDQAEPPRRAKKPSARELAGIPKPTTSIVQISAMLLLLASSGLIIAALKMLPFRVVILIVLDGILMFLGVKAPDRDIAASFHANEREGLELALQLLTMGVVTGLILLIVMFAWIGYAWQSIPAARGGMSAVRALAPLFIPFFNMYWLFVVIPGLSATLQANLEYRFPGFKFRTGFGAGIAFCVMLLLPLINLLALFPLAAWVTATDRALTQFRKSVLANAPAGSGGPSASSTPWLARRG